MTSPEPSLDADRTVTQEHKLLPRTMDVSRPEESTGHTGPFIPTALAEAPRIPGYRIMEMIAKGGMGQVYAGYDLTLDREVAIKTLLPGADAERFVTEAKITAKLPHPGIPTIGSSIATISACGRRSRRGCWSRRRRFAPPRPAATRVGACRPRLTTPPVPWHCASRSSRSTRSWTPKSGKRRCSSAATNPQPR